VLILPWDAALDEAEWREWLGEREAFGVLVVNNLDPARAPVVVPREHGVPTSH
jgi:transcriptional regulator